MYFIYLTTLLIAVYIAPAIAIRPHLILDSRYSLAVPFVSLLAIYCISLALTTLGWLTPNIVRGVTLCIVVIAITRLARLLRCESSTFWWPKQHVYLILFNLSIALYFLAKMSSAGFDTDDEIYSWNMWSVQYFHNEDIDFYYTQAPYPQFFPRILSFCYLILGSTELQLPVKGTLAFLPLLLFTAIGLSSSRITTKTFWLNAFLAVFFAFVVKAGKLFDDGMPDTMTASAITVSVFYLTLLRRETNQLLPMLLCATCATVALLCKQPGLLWGLFSLPILILLDIMRKQIPPWSILIFAFPIIAGVLWLISEGSGFQDNRGVISRSFEHRNYLEQLIYGVWINVSNVPATAILCCFAIWGIIRSKLGLDILLIYVLPGLAAWVLFASYDMRAGLPPLAVLAFLVAYSDYGLRRSEADKIENGQMAYASKILAVILLLFLFNVVYAFISVNQIHKKNPDYDFSSGGKNAIYKYFGKDSKFVYLNIYEDKNLKLWIDNNYIYGLFYGQAEIVRPSRLRGGKYNAKRLLLDIKIENPDYLFHAGELSTESSGRALKTLATEKCPKMFIKVAGPDNRRGYTVYSLDKEMLKSGYCSI